MKWGVRLISAGVRLVIGALQQLLHMPARLVALRSERGGRFRVSSRELRMHLLDAVRVTSFDRHYVYHVAWALRVLKATPGLKEHVDISSSLHFAAAASVLVPTRFYDYRPADLQLCGLSSGRADLMRLPFPTGSVISLSCMHVVEHVGLGRYGDPFDPLGDVKAVEELKRVLVPGGQLLFVVPVAGEARIEFNAHRVYTYVLVSSMFKGFELVEYALIPDEQLDGGLIRHADPALTDHQHYGCGCFHFKKDAL
jgi:SAM-dependent methyltransferase